MQKLFLYHTLGCHLCELAKEQIEPLLVPCQLKLVEVDIADDDSLMEKYGVRIPVIRLENHTLELGWPFDTAGAYEFLQSH